MNKPKCGSPLLLGGALFLAAADANAISLTVDPAITAASISDHLFVDVSISGLLAGAAPSLGAFDFNLNFDPAILHFEGLTFGTVVDESGAVDGVDRGVSLGTGKVNPFWISLQTPGDLDSLQPGAFVLTRLEFKALATGVSPLSLTVNAFGDALGDSLTVDELAGGSVSVQSSGGVTVPDNSNAAFALSLGLLGLLATQGVRTAGRAKPCSS